MILYDWGESRERRKRNLAERLEFNPDQVFNHQKWLNNPIRIMKGIGTPNSNSKMERIGFPQISILLVR